MLDPTPFSFEDPDRLRTIRQIAGFQRIDVRAINLIVQRCRLRGVVGVLIGASLITGKITARRLTVV